MAMGSYAIASGDYSVSLGSETMPPVFLHLQSIMRIVQLT
ncbi:MAG: hypothetical protein HWD58_16930 [Bacteroidota bacterium]|nr:MAG: hypothetical protein HWD58_16930 [Bacteroidota bacterium]